MRKGTTIPAGGTIKRRTIQAATIRRSTLHAFAVPLTGHRLRPARSLVPLRIRREVLVREYLRLRARSLLRVLFLSILTRNFAERLAVCVNVHQQSEREYLQERSLHKSLQ